MAYLTRYDPRHNSWCDIEPLQQQHADHCVCVADGCIYAIGGRDYSVELECVERYNPQTNTWEYVAPLKREVDTDVVQIHTCDTCTYLAYRFTAACVIV